MIYEDFISEKRKPRTENLDVDLVITGGGMAGTCAAITAARRGHQVVLVQDRPVLGGNASSEIRLWILGATSHMGNNNRWAREGGVIDEILLENLYRNPEGNPLILDTILLEKVYSEPNITLLLNTSVYDLEKKSADEIEMVRAFCSQTSTEYHLKAPFFIDSSGDGIISFMAGAAFRIGAEKPDEFDEGFAPDHQYGELLGHSIYFYSKDTGKPVKFIPPSYALTDISQLPRYRSFNLKDHGCRLWWVEYGGRLDTIHESEKIKFELWRIIYGIWNHIKNSGEFPDSENLTLEWVGTIPGKRESRRFEGDYMINQKDLVEQRRHYDAVSFGGWALDLHPADGVYGDQPGCNQWHTKGIYQIPYRCFYSKNIKNLFLAGRIISATHVAFGSTRVMATCAAGGQAVATAASLCLTNRWTPNELAKPEKIGKLQQELLKSGQHIPHQILYDNTDLATIAGIESSSTFHLLELPFDGPWYQLEYPVAQLIPVQKGELPAFEILLNASEQTSLKVELRCSEDPSNYTPEIILAKKEYLLQSGENQLTINFDTEAEEDGYLFFSIMKNEAVQIKCSSQRVSGLLTVFKKFNKAVSNDGEQIPPDHLGIDRFEFWVPERRPAGHNLAFKLNSPAWVFNPEHIRNGINRPTITPNSWVADLEDKNPALTLNWEEEQSISKIVLSFDSDFDHALESTLLGHPERVVPFCIRSYTIEDANGSVVYRCEENHQTNNIIIFREPLKTRRLVIKPDHPSQVTPAAIFGIRCYE